MLPLVVVTEIGPRLRSAITSPLTLRISLGPESATLMLPLVVTMRRLAAPFTATSPLVDSSSWEPCTSSEVRSPLVLLSEAGMSSGTSSASRTSMRGSSKSENKSQNLI